MKKILFTLALTGMVYTIFAQDPQLTEWKFNTDGHLAIYNSNTSGGYTEEQLSDSSDIKALYYDNDYVYVTSEGLASYVMGAWDLPVYPSAQGYTYQIPRNPQEETGTKTSLPLGGPAAYAVNGVPIYGYGSADSWDGSGNSSGGMHIWNNDAWVNEGENMDENGGGHADGTGSYHYHATPFALYDKSNTTDHSPIIGWAPDGYPMYGPYGYTDSMDANSAIKRMESGYTLRNITQRTTLPDGTVLSPPQYGPDVSATYPLGTYIEDYEYIGGADLDVYCGRYCVTPEFPNGTYAYFLPVDNVGEPAFPYFFGDSYYGKVDATVLSNIGSASIPSNATRYTEYMGVKSALNLQFTIYPNPAKSSFALEFGAMQSLVKSVRLFDLIGNEIKTIENYTFVNVQDLPRGTYFLRIDTKNGVAIKQVIIG